MEVTPDELYELKSDPHFICGFGKNPEPREQGILIAGDGFRTVLLKTESGTQRLDSRDKATGTDECIPRSTDTMTEEERKLYLESMGF